MAARILTSMVLRMPIACTTRPIYQRGQMLKPGPAHRGPYRSLTSPAGGICGQGLRRVSERPRRTTQRHERTGLGKRQMSVSVQSDVE